MLKWTEEVGGEDEPNWFAARFVDDGVFALVEPKDDNKGWVAWRYEHSFDILSFQTFQDAKAQVEEWYCEWQIWEAEQEYEMRVAIDQDYERMYGLHP